MDFRDFLDNFTSLDICNLSPETNTMAMKQWIPHTYHSRWVKGYSAGGRPACRGELLDRMIVDTDPGHHDPMVELCLGNTWKPTVSENQLFPKKVWYQSFHETVFQNYTKIGYDFKGVASIFNFKQYEDNFTDCKQMHLLTVQRWSVQNFLKKIFLKLYFYHSQVPCGR